MVRRICLLCLTVACSFLPSAESNQENSSTAGVENAINNPAISTWQNDIGIAIFQNLSSTDLAFADRLWSGDFGQFLIEKLHVARFEKLRTPARATVTHSNGFAWRLNDVVVTYDAVLSVMKALDWRVSFVTLQQTASGTVTVTFARNHLRSLHLDVIIEAFNSSFVSVEEGSPLNDTFAAWLYEYSVDRFCAHLQDGFEERLSSRNASLPSENVSPAIESILFMPWSQTDDHTNVTESERNATASSGQPHYSLACGVRTNDAATTPSPFGCSGKRTGWYGDPSEKAAANCTRRYFRCTATGRQLAFNCATGLKFSVSAQRCLRDCAA